MTCRVLLGSTLVAGIATVLAVLAQGPAVRTGPVIRPHVPLPGADGPQACFTGFY
jgi:hypothetical protein